MAAGGYFGKALVVDVTHGETVTLPLPDRVLRAYLGGAGLGTWLLHRLGPAGVAPLGPEAPLAFVFSPVVGTPLTTSAKFAVVAKSPLTGLLTDALASSQFAIAGKLTGYDAIAAIGPAGERGAVEAARAAAKEAAVQSAANGDNGHASHNGHARHNGAASVSSAPPSPSGPTTPIPWPATVTPWSERSSRAVATRRGSSPH